MKNLQLTITNDVTYHEAKKRLERLVNHNINATELFLNYEDDDSTNFQNYIESLIMEVSINYHVSQRDLKEMIGEEYSSNLRAQISVQSYEEFQRFYNKAFNKVGV